jgi:two-component system invasion response regulator UvrY
MDAVGVLAVDHREPFRRAARELISATPGFTWLAEAASAEEALEAAVHLRPGLVLVEANMPGIDGLETSRLLKEALPATVVVVVSVEGSADLATLTPGALRALWQRHGPA